MRTRRLSSLLVAVSSAVALLAVTVPPASGGGVSIIGIDQFANDNGFEPPPLLDLEVTNVDAFTDGPPSVSNPIVNMGGITLDPLALGRDPVVFGRAIGLDVRFLTSEDNFFVDIGLDFRGLGPPPSEPANAMLIAMIEENIAQLEDADLENIGRFALSGEGEMPTPEWLQERGSGVIEGLEGVVLDLGDEAAGVDATIDSRYDEVLAEIRSDLAEFGLDGPFSGSAEPGFLATELLGPNAPPGQPLHTLRDGGVLILTELEDPFGSAGGNALSEVFLNLNLDEPLEIDGIVAPGGPPFVNPSFRNDAFTGSNTEAILREPVGGEQMLETQLFQDGFFQPVAPIVPMAATDELVVAIVPTPLFEQSSGIRVGSFVSEDGAFGPGLVGTSTDVPISDELPVREFAPIQIDPPPSTLATPEIAEALRQWIVDIGAAEPDPAVDTPEPDVPPAADDATDDPVPVETPVASTDGGDDGFPWGPVAIGVGILAIAGGFLLNRSGGSESESDEEMPLAGRPPDDHSPSHVCDWELHWLNGSSWDKLRSVAPGHNVCCVYKVAIETTTTMHFLTASFRQDVEAARLYIPDPDFSWNGLDFHGHAATRSGPAGRQDWQQGHGDPVDQAALAPDEGYWQSNQGEERPEVAARIIHRETTTISLTLEPGCTDPESEYAANGKGVLDFLSTQECTNDDPAAGCPVELNAFGRALAEVKGDLNWRLAHQTGTDIDELERGGRVRPLWDSHDHETLDDSTWTEQAVGNDNQVSIAFTWDAEIVNEVTFDAAQLVPQHVWPTTERVSTWAGSDASYDIAINAKMDKGDCVGQGCCGHDAADHTCRCAPAFTLTLDGDNSRITVDGSDTLVGRERDADRRQPPEWFSGGLTMNPGPGVSRNWKTTP